MPITINNNNLTLENNKINATYTELFGKLNVAKAWSVTISDIEYVVYTTKNPSVGNIAYSDVDLTQYSTIQNIGDETITDEYRTYSRDSSKDSSFTAIPPATANETVTIEDFLRITNPNS